MPELLAAVMRVQFKRLEGLLESLRARKHMLVEGLQDLANHAGVQLQRIPDPGGDAAIALILLAPDAQHARQIADGLNAENANAFVIYRPEVVDYHVYAHWQPILTQRAWTPAGGPWRWAQRKIEYAPEMCPRSLDLLGRAVHLNVNPLFTNQDIEETLEAFQRVMHA